MMAHNGGYCPGVALGLTPCNIRLVAYRRAPQCGIVVRDQQKLFLSTRIRALNLIQEYSEALVHWHIPALRVYMIDILNLLRIVDSTLLTGFL